MEPAKLNKLIIIALAAIVLTFGLYFFNFHGAMSDTPGDWGTFGDFVGGVLNPIFGFLSFTAVLITIILQNKEMNLTRQELELTRKEMERSASTQERAESALRLQADTQIKQQFEGTFFSLLNEHNRSLQEVTSQGPQLKSRFTRLEEAFGNAFHLCHSLTESKLQLESDNHLCGTYFRILYQILKFIATNSPGTKIGVNFIPNLIENSPLAPNEKMYANIVRSFLPDKALQLLAVNCACEDDNDPFWNFRLLIERYQFLEHMPFETEGELRPTLVELISAYKPIAFGSSIYLTDEFQEIESQDQIQPPPRLNI
jgi:uncharacterized membrane protein